MAKFQFKQSTLDYINDYHRKITEADIALLEDAAARCYVDDPEFFSRSWEHQELIVINAYQKLKRKGKKTNG